MILREFEAKALLRNTGLLLPKSICISSEAAAVTRLEKTMLKYPQVVKAQVLHGNRAQQGLISTVGDELKLEETVTALFAKKDQFGQPITDVLLEQAVQYTTEVYLALTYDTRTRSLVVQYSPMGGVGMDERGESLISVPLSVVTAPTEFLPDPTLLPVLQKLWKVFLQHDATLLEINPLVATATGEWVCLDAKVELDEAARFRHPEWKAYGERSSMGRRPTQREQAALAVSRSDHRGVAGESFFEFPGGTIGVMASGGGASTLAMDALLAAGLHPANYTEYSGNPNREKVAALANVVLSIPNLEALYVVGSNANFTDIYETLAGVVDGILDSQYKNVPGFCILIRRGGPNWQEAFAMVAERLAEFPLSVQLFGPDFPLVETAQELQKMIQKTKER